jgi:hypothetical protein
MGLEQLPASLGLASIFLTDAATSNIMDARHLAAIADLPNVGFAREAVVRVRSVFGPAPDRCLGRTSLSTLIDLCASLEIEPLRQAQSSKLLSPPPAERFSVSMRLGSKRIASTRQFSAVLRTIGVTATNLHAGCEQAFARYMIDL